MRKAEWRSEDDGGSADEPLYTDENRRKNEANLRQRDEDASYHGSTILLTTPEAHDGHSMSGTDTPWNV